MAAKMLKESANGTGQPNRSIIHYKTDAIFPVIRFWAMVDVTIGNRYIAPRIMMVAVTEPALEYERYLRALSLIHI